MEKEKYYRPDHKLIKVKCPCCGKLMQGWTYSIDWKLYWINHVTPNPKGKECWATEEQMKDTLREWENKYELREREPVS